MPQLRTRIWGDRNLKKDFKEIRIYKGYDVLIADRHVKRAAGTVNNSV